MYVSTKRLHFKLNPSYATGDSLHTPNTYTSIFINIPNTTSKYTTTMCLTSVGGVVYCIMCLHLNKESPGSFTSQYKLCFLNLNMNTFPISHKSHKKTSYF